VIKEAADDFARSMETGYRMAGGHARL
jgi:hypothetical protein